MVTSTLQVLNSIDNARSAVKQYQGLTDTYSETWYVHAQNASDALDQASMQMVEGWQLETGAFSWGPPDENVVVQQLVSYTDMIAAITAAITAIGQYQTANPVTKDAIMAYAGSATNYLNKALAEAMLANH